MAFRKDRTTAAQTALNSSASIVTGLVTQGAIATVASAKKALVELYQTAFAEIGPVVDSDNEVFAAAEQAEGSKPRSSTKTASKANGSKTAKKDSVPDDAGEFILSGGKFKDLTIAEIYAMDAEEAGKTYGHREGEAGSTYVGWLASERNNNEIRREAAQRFLAQVGA